MKGAVLSLEALTTIASTAATLVGLAVTASRLSYQMGKKFAVIESRLQEQDRRLGDLENKIIGLENKVVGLENKVTGLESRITGFEGKIAGLGERITGVEEKLDKRIAEAKDELNKRIVEVEGRLNKRIADVEGRLAGKIERLAYAFTSYQEFLMKYFVSEGVLRREAAEMIATEARNLMRLAVSNPFTKEEWERLKVLLDKSEKDELSLDEAYELLNLARKAVMEYGEYPEAWKLHMYAAMMVGFAWKKAREAEKTEKRGEEKKPGSS
ncbi:hypothetical protein IG193_01925 [Infirmifilum lucidum]|uniref:Uncharacterized protein n=1 Tax=Infirmifilum lucidum TaxID=2776706 RepID=A0A7L9FKB3_9CREN|nr:hypothetical protein [Infirmifilum lucidum]QOJ79245.1 hypothetical protein IG193_01925 [Infirmifilum lucidum]